MTISAKFYVSVNGGANQDLGIEVPSAATVLFIPASTVGWLRARWEIYDYPEGYATPAGWSLDALTGTIYYVGINPPLITLPSNTLIWGKWMLRCLVNEQIDDDQNLLAGLYDSTTALSMLSPNGLRGMGARELDHFTSAVTRIKAWARDIQRNNLIIDQVGIANLLPTISNPNTGTLTDIISTSAGANASEIIFTGNGAKSLNSLASPGQSRLVTLINRGTGTLTIAHETTGTLANRIITASAGNVDVPSGFTAQVAYDNVSTRWVLITAIAIAPTGSTDEIVTRASTGMLATATGVKAGANYASVGTNPALSGGLRLANNTAVKYRNVSNTADLSAMYLTAANVFILGDDTLGNGYIYIHQGVPTVRIAAWNGSTAASQVEYDGVTAYNGVPRVGNATPYASEGRITQGMSDANQTLSSSTYSRKFIRLNGALTAVRTATFPHPSSETNSYSKHIENLCTGSNLLISTGTGTTIVMIPNQSLVLDFTPSGVKLGIADGNPDINGFRLTSATGVAVADSTSSPTSIFFTPYLSGAIALYDGSSWVRRVSAEVSLALSSLTSGKNYDVFVNWSGSAIVLTLVVWSTDTARATALATQDGVLVQTGDATKRYVGTIRTTGAAQTQDTPLQRYVWNYYNRVPRRMVVTDPTDSWAYTTASFRQSNGATGNKFEYVVGDTNTRVVADVYSAAQSATSATPFAAGVGIDSTSVNSSQVYGSCTPPVAVASPIIARAYYEGVSALGYHAINWLEYGGTGISFFGDGGVPARFQAGMFGTLQG